MTLQYVNGFSKAIAVAVVGTVPGPADTTITLETGAGALLPAGASLTANPMRFVLRNGTTSEVVEATDRTGDVLTVTRAVEAINGASTAHNFAVAGTVIENSPTAGTMSQYISDGSTLSTGLTLPNTGLHLLDTNASHDLIIAPGSNITADRTLTVTTGDSDRTLTFTADASIGGTNTGDQTVTNSSDATSHTVTLSASGGSLKLVEGTNITLTTTGTASDGIVTIAASGGGGTPGGANTNIQFNDSGAFGGDANLVWDKTNDRFGVGAGATAPSNPLHVDASVAADYSAYVHNTNATGRGLKVRSDNSGSTPNLQVESTAGTGLVVNSNGTAEILRGLVINGTSATVAPLTVINSALVDWTAQINGFSNSLGLVARGGSNANSTRRALEAQNAAGSQRVAMHGNGEVRFFYGASDAAATQWAFFDATNQRVGIGTGTPAVPLDVVGDINNTGHIKMTVAGKGLYVKEGADAKMGQAVLVAGTVTVSTTAVTANSRIFLTCAVAGGTKGFLSVGTITAATSFVINSTSATDTSTINWLIVEPA